MSRQNKKEPAAVQVFRLTNRLKKKLGLQVQTNEPGYIDPEAIAQADQLIEKLCAECPNTIAGHLENLSKLWESMRDMPRSQARDDIAAKMFTIAHEIKDLGAMCGYTLSAYFAESLRDYVAKTELKLEAQRVIIQAHVDALQVVQKHKLQDEAGSAAAELKEMVKIAIQKYS